MISKSPGASPEGAVAAGGDLGLWEEEFSLWELFGDDEDEAFPDRSMPSSKETVDHRQEEPVDWMQLEGSEEQSLIVDDQEDICEAVEDEEEEVRALDLPARRKWA